MLPLLDKFRHWFTSDPCPDEHMLSAYADQQLVGSERHGVEHHLAHCDACLSQVTFLVKADPADDSEREIADDVIWRALALPSSGSRRFGRVGKLRLAIACAVIVLVVLWGMHRPTEVKTQAADVEPTSKSTVEVASNEPVKTPAIDDSNQVRGRSEAPLAVLSPVPNQIVAGSFRVDWNSVGGADFYEIELTSDDGSMLWHKQVRSSAVVVPASVRLVKGNRYFIRLKVQFSTGSVEHSRAVPFIAG